MILNGIDVREVARASYDALHVQVGRIRSIASFDDGAAGVVTEFCGLEISLGQTIAFYGKPWDELTPDEQDGHIENARRTLEALITCGYVVRKRLVAVPT